MMKSVSAIVDTRIGKSCFSLYLKKIEKAFATVDSTDLKLREVKEFQGNMLT